MSQARGGVLLVGSSNLKDASTTFRKCTTALPNRLKRIPDGETSERHNFTLFQAAFFAAVPELMTHFEMNTPIPATPSNPEQVASGIEKLKQAKPETGYDTAAIESYAIFKQLRDEGVIPDGVKFQVCLPTVASVIAPFVQRDFQSAAEPVYEAALFRAMQNIQSSIPHEDLSIQVDLAADTAFWEDFKMYPPWFHGGSSGSEMEARKKYMVDYTTRLFAQVAEDVELGIHNCYGDMAHRHWMEPADLGVIAERGLAFFEKSSRRIDYFHLPVPVSAMDHLGAFFEPLKALVPALRAQGTELYLGVVQFGDLEGTEEHIRAAREALGDFPFGVATECGWGRTPEGEIEGILDISREVSAPVR